MGKLWRVDKALEDSEGLRWIRERLDAYDWAKVDLITVRCGRSERHAFRGVCRSPSKGHGYRTRAKGPTGTHRATAARTPRSSRA